ncbi:MAG: hypothetical protein KF795_19320 [Labilithrix sp.]|nr:hypothetical protein [Labilithrix sp.]
MVSLGRSVPVVCLGVLLVATAGCKRDRADRDRAGAASTATTQSADVASMAKNASERVADARCRREVSCDHVGPSRRHESLETCRGLYAWDMARKLNAEACPRGIDEAQLTRCVASIDAAGCFDPVSVFERLEECRASKLCLAGVGP